MHSDDQELLAELLEDELRRLGKSFPGLSFRFCRIMGRRISHITGEIGDPFLEELRIPAGPSLLLMVSGRWTGRDEELASCAEKIAGRISTVLAGDSEEDHV